MTVGLPLVSDIAETPRVTIVDSKYTADGKVEPQQRMSPKGKPSVSRFIYESPTSPRCVCVSCDGTDNGRGVRFSRRDPLKTTIVCSVFTTNGALPPSPEYVIGLFLRPSVIKSFRRYNKAFYVHTHIYISVDGLSYVPLPPSTRLRNRISSIPLNPFAVPYDDDYFAGPSAVSRVRVSYASLKPFSRI